MAVHPDLEAEQAHIDHAYRRLEAMRAQVAGMLRDAFSQGAGTAQALTERDVIVRTSLSRLEQLQLGREALVFGRIDRAAPDGDGRPEAFHIGRLAVSDEDQEPLGVDWRGPGGGALYPGPRPPPRVARAGRGLPTSAGWPSPTRTGSRWWWTGGRGWPSRSTGPPAATRWA